MSKIETDTLCVLAVESPLSIADVNKTLGRKEKNRTNVARALRSLRESGLVRGTRDHSRRGAPHSHELTDDGKRLVKLNVVRLARLIETREVLES